MPEGAWSDKRERQYEHIKAGLEDRGRSEDVRRIWPFLRDRRIDAYADILRRYRD